MSKYINYVIKEQTNDMDEVSINLTLEQFEILIHGTGIIYKNKEGVFIYDNCEKEHLLDEFEELLALDTSSDKFLDNEAFCLADEYGFNKLDVRRLIEIVKELDESYVKLFVNQLQAAEPFLNNFLIGDVSSVLRVPVKEVINSAKQAINLAKECHDTSVFATRMVNDFCETNKSVIQ